MNTDFLEGVGFFPLFLPYFFSAIEFGLKILPHLHLCLSVAFPFSSFIAVNGYKLRKPNLGRKAWKITGNTAFSADDLLAIVAVGIYNAMSKRSGLFFREYAIF